MRPFLTLFAAAFAFVLNAGALLAETDLTGVWQGTYTAVSPTNLRGEGPRFNEAEWRLNVTQQRGNVFYGETKWRSSTSPEWKTLQVTGNISADGEGRIGMVEIGSGDPYHVQSMINGQIKDGQIFIDFRSLRTGTTYSTVLERVSGEE